jgi:hypothetical protein
MTQLRQIGNKQFLQELKKRVAENKISEEEVFIVLEKPKIPEIITEYKKVDFSKLTKEDWKIACESLEKDKNYQEEVKLWESIDDE